jgi:acetyltransferase EpsM
MRETFCIYGASGHSKVIIEIIEKLGRKINLLFDDDLQKKHLLDYKVTNDPSTFELKSVLWIIGIGNNIARKKIVEKYPLAFGVVIAKEANISIRTEIGRGTVIMPGVSINSSSKIGMHSIINTNSSIDHDCVLEDYVHLSPNATLCGGVTVHEGTQIGAGAVIIPGIKAGKWCTIGAGAVIIKDIPDYSTVVGNPGKLIRQNVFK